MGTGPVVPNTQLSLLCDKLSALSHPSHVSRSVKTYVPQVGWRDKNIGSFHNFFLRPQSQTVRALREEMLKFLSIIE